MIKWDLKPLQIKQRTQSTDVHRQWISQQDYSDVTQPEFVSFRASFCPRVCFTLSSLLLLRQDGKFRMTFCSIFSCNIQKSLPPPFLCTVVAAVVFSATSALIQASAWPTSPPLFVRTLAWFDGLRVRLAVTDTLSLNCFCVTLLFSFFFQWGNWVFQKRSGRSRKGLILF